MTAVSGAVDAHVHFWDPAELDYDWLADEPKLHRAFVPADYREAVGRLPIERLVFVQCGPAGVQALDEVRWIASLAADEPRIAAIVAQSPLEAGEAVRGHLESLRTLPLVRGVRRLIQSEPDDFCLRPAFVRGVQLLAEFGFSFDLCVCHRQLANVVRLVEQCPLVHFALDHLGKPDVKGRGLDPWRDNLRALAGFSNVSCKLSGLVTEADHERWSAADLRPYVEHAVECFGYGRLMFGSDWPVATLAATYARWFEALGELVAGAAPADRQRLLAGTADEFYRLT